MWLTYEEYIQRDGERIPLNEYNTLEMKVRKRIDYLTLERITVPSDDIKTLVFELIGMLKEFEKQEHNVSGYGNDGVSVSFVSPESAKKDFDKRADDLIYSVVGNLAYRGCG